jgi:ABC-type branched-subunit amino acid transport system substrate-binding protein
MLGWNWRSTSLRGLRASIKTRSWTQLRKQNVETLIGRVKFDEKSHHYHTPLVTGQWVKGKTWPWEPVIINNKDFPAIPVTASG